MLKTLNAVIEGNEPRVLTVQENNLFCKINSCFKYFCHHLYLQFIDSLLSHNRHYIHFIHKQGPGC